MAILSNLKSKMNEIGSITLDHMDQNIGQLSSVKRIGSALAAITFFGAAIAAYCLFLNPSILGLSELATAGIMAGFSVASLTSSLYPYLKKPVDGETLYSKLKANFFPEPVQLTEIPKK